MLSELQHRLVERVKKQTLPARLLLQRFRFPDESMRKKPEFTDNAWMPFWYYLGAEEKPKSLLDVGSKLGLEAACCVLGAKQPVTTSIHAPASCFTSSNIKLAGGDVLLECGGDWDLAVVNGDFSDRLDSIWSKMKLGGLICVTDNREGLESFAKVKNRVPVFCKLRYSVGLLRK